MKLELLKKLFSSISYILDGKELSEIAMEILGHWYSPVWGDPALSYAVYGLIGAAIFWIAVVSPLIESKPFATVKKLDEFPSIAETVDTMTEFTVAKTITVDCPECQGSHVVKAGQRNGYQRYQCQGCKKKFRQGGPAKGRKYDAELIGATIRDYYMGLSIKQLAESIADRYGIPEPSKGTIYGWISDYTDKATYALRDVKAHTSGHWVADEMYVKVGGITVYYWVVMDKGTRYILGSYLSASRGEDAATEVLRKALAVADRPPNRITTDKWTAYPPAIRAVLPRTTKHIRANHITDFINNNLSERMNGTYRAREKTLRGMDSIESGQHLLDGFTLTYNLFRDHHALKGRKPADAAKVDIPF